MTLLPPPPPCRPLRVSSKARTAPRCPCPHAELLLPSTCHLRDLYSSPILLQAEELGGCPGGMLQGFLPWPNTGSSGIAGPVLPAQSSFRTSPYTHHHSPTHRSCTLPVIHTEGPSSVAPRAPEERCGHIYSLHTPTGEGAHGSRWPGPLSRRRRNSSSPCCSQCPPWKHGRAQPLSELGEKEEVGTPAPWLEDPTRRFLDVLLPEQLCMPRAKAMLLSQTQHWQLGWTFVLPQGDPVFLSPASAGPSPFL